MRLNRLFYILLCQEGIEKTSYGFRILHINGCVGVKLYSLAYTQAVMN
jgi:hypothetical protein